MKHFTSVNDVQDAEALAQAALEIKRQPSAYSEAGKNKTLALVFLNPSLRTRMSMQKAAMNLGMQVIVINADKDGWALEFEDGAVMNGASVEHVKEAAGVMGKYCDILGIRSFPGLRDREEDYSEKILKKFIEHSGVPVVSLESATRHPLQSLADLMTIRETWKKKTKPKVVLTWAPHVKPLPQAVANSFAEWMCRAEVELVITHPEGYELHEAYTRGAEILYNQQEALRGADYVYVKNWSSYKEYGKILCSDDAWMLTQEKLKITNRAKVMHCLPVRRNVELSDEVLDGHHALHLLQAENRIYAAKAVLKMLLDHDQPDRQVDKANTLTTIS
ncbi:MAG: ornithine carbamoyltransferase [Chitinophagales bacterium]|nr:MAG: ornithine carbamoyltransferase [Chitinophagales bacterium]